MKAGTVRMHDVTKVAAVGFWPGFEKMIHPYYDFLTDRYGLQFSDDPDYVFTSVFDTNPDTFPADRVRIGILFENVRPDFNWNDYVLGFDYMEFEDRYLRYPLWARAWRHGELPDRSDEKLFDRDFCSVVIGNALGTIPRCEFAALLSGYRPVASGGSVDNNIGRSIGPSKKDKIDFCSGYKFNIAFENSSTNGYTTEKIVDAFQAGSIPIYAGNPLVTRDFNPKAFINCNDFDSYEEVVERVREIDNDKDLYMSMLTEDPLTEEGRAYLEDSYLTDFFDNIFLQGREKALRRTLGSWEDHAESSPIRKRSIGAGSLLKRAVKEALRGKF